MTSARPSGGVLKTREWKMQEWKTSGANPEGAEPAPLNAANIKPNAKFTSLKYIEHNVIFHPFQRSNQKFIKTDRPARYISI